MQNYYLRCTESGLAIDSDSPLHVSLDSLCYSERGCIAEYIISNYDFVTLVQITSSSDAFQDTLHMTLDELYLHMIDWVKVQLQS